MSRLEQILTTAMEMRAGELWMAPGQPARARIGRDWREVSSESWAPHETKALLASSLSEFDKREFFDRGFWTGQIRLMGRPLQLQLQITEQGIAGAFKWRGTESLDWESWNLPVHTLDVVMRTRGLTCLTGPSRSGKSSLISLLMQKLGAASTPLVHLYSDSAPTELPNRISSLPLKSLAHAIQGPADVILVDNPPIDQWSTVLDLCESGRHVVFSMTSIDLFSGLERWRVFHEKSGRRGLDGLQMGIGSRLVAGLETPLAPAVELLLVTQKLRPALAAGKWNEVEDEMRATGEKTGMRTLNQSLLQLLLRRKIEMKTAFHESQNPDEFDHLLKKVGI